jgi:uncharacterized protein with HEPN domain
MRSQELYLMDINDSIEKILQYIRDLSHEYFSENLLIFDAVIRNLEIIGEAAKNVSEETTSEYHAHPMERYGRYAKHTEQGIFWNRLFHSVEYDIVVVYSLEGNKKYIKACNVTERLPHIQLR